MGIKENNPGPKYFKGDNSREIISSVRQPIGESFVILLTVLVIKRLCYSYRLTVKKEALLE